MPQELLDPDALDKCAGEYQASECLTPAIWKFGYYPNVDEWMPGDLVLIRNLNGNFTHRTIEFFQRYGGYKETDSRWHHAAVYLGYSGDLCEADTSGVIHSSINRYVSGHHMIRVRRDVHLDETTRWWIAIRALTRLRQSYSYSTIVETGLLALSRFRYQLPLTRHGSASSMICSKLYADAYQTATLKMLSNSSSTEVTPAFLSSTNRLADVPVTCRRLSQ